MKLSVDRLDAVKEVDKIMVKVTFEDKVFVQEAEPHEDVPKKPTAEDANKYCES